MKVLIAATNSEMFSGATRCLIELAKGLIDKQHDVVILLPREGDIEDELEHRKIRYYIIHEYHSWYTSAKHKNNQFRVKRLLNLKAIYQAKQLLRRECVDIVHVNALTGYTVGKAAIELNIPVVWHIREFMEEDLNISFYDRKYSLNLLNRANQFVAISQPIYDKWSKILKAPIEIVHDGVPVEDYYIFDKEKHNAVNILLYGRIVAGKGQLFYVKGAIEALKHISVPCHFFFAGKIEDVGYYRKCVAEIEKNDCGDAIEYIGEISDIKELLKKTDIVCVCSKMEGFGRVTVEAMLGKCLVIGANTGATQEIIKNEQNGLVYREEDIGDFSVKLTAAVNSLNEYKDCISAGQMYALTTFTTEKNVSSILNVYADIIEKQKDEMYR